MSSNKTRVLKLDKPKKEWVKTYQELNILAKISGHIDLWYEHYPFKKWITHKYFPEVDMDHDDFPDIDFCDEEIIQEWIITILVLCFLRITKMFLTLLPAYGRDYKSKKLIIDDLNNNKDFLESTTRKYINKEQFKELDISSFNVRYDSHRKITNIKIKDLKN